MSPALTPARAEAGLWLILCLGLAAGIGLETDWGRQMQWPVTESAAAPPEFARPRLAEPFRLASPEQYLEISARPLFVITRRPAPVNPAGDAAQPSMKKDQFVLMGTSVVGGSKFAFLFEKAANKNRVVAEGKEINGIMVKEVGADRVVLTQHGDSEVLQLYIARSPQAPLPPGVPRR